MGECLSSPREVEEERSLMVEVAELSLVVEVVGGHQLEEVVVDSLRRSCRWAVVVVPPGHLLRPCCLGVSSAVFRGGFRLCAKTIK